MLLLQLDASLLSWTEDDTAQHDQETEQHPFGSDSALVVLTPSRCPHPHSYGLLGGLGLWILHSAQVGLCSEDVLSKEAALVRILPS